MLVLPLTSGAPRVVACCAGLSLHGRVPWGMYAKCDHRAAEERLKLNAVDLFSPPEARRMQEAS